MYENGQKCPICANGKLARKIISETFDYKGRSLVVSDYVIFECSTCREELVASETIKKTEKTIRDFQKMTDGLLTSDQIKKGRTALGFTQEAFSELLGVGLKSFARYENGKVTQNKSMDNLLRIIFEYPQTIDAITNHRFTFENVAPVYYSTKPSDYNIVYSFVEPQKKRA